MNRKVLAPLACGLVSAYMVASLVIRTKIVELGSAGLALSTGWFVLPLAFLSAFFCYRDSEAGGRLLAVGLSPIVGVTLLLVVFFGLPLDGALTILLSVVFGTYLGGKMGQVVSQGAKDSVAKDSGEK